MNMKVLVVATVLWAMTGVSTYAETPDNHVTVLTSGYVRPIEGQEFLPGVQPDGVRKVASSISVVQGKDLVLIVDPGMAAAGVWDDNLATLQALGITPKDVTHVFISHHHPDHTTHLGLFPNATIVDFWATYKDDLWKDHPDPYELAPGVKVVRTPGHTDEDASLLVETIEGSYAFTHLWWGPKLAPKKDPLAEDPDALQESRQRILLQADWIVPGHGKTFHNPHRKEADITKKQRETLLAAVKKASAAWVEAFNKGDAAGCAHVYEANAIMSAKPFGTFTGRKNIQAFWKKLIAEGYAKVRYDEPTIEVINANTAVVSANWEMNKAHGVITKELWVLQKNGQAKLKVDAFKVLGNK
ncbi:MBL fold metallo-hydrolase [Nitrospira sp. M1]